jgi:hypothetical protein
VSYSPGWLSISAWGAFFFTDSIPLNDACPRWQVSLVADHLAVWGDQGEVIFAASALGEHELARALTPL